MRLGKYLTILAILFLASSASAALLTGQTPGSYSLPSGWSLVIATDFEGALSGAENTNMSFATDRFHTGSRSISKSITGDAADASWWLRTNQIGSFTEVYVSWYEYLETAARHNDEFWLLQFLKRAPDDTMWQEIIATWMWAGFNETASPLFIVPQTEVDNLGATWRFGGGSHTVPSGSWVQWEIHYKPNSNVGDPYNDRDSDGFLRVYKDGALWESAESKSLNANVDMSNMSISIGGVYTKLTWLLSDQSCAAYFGSGTDSGPRVSNFNSPCYCTNQCPPSGYVPIFKRYFDDVIIMKLTGAGGGYDSQPPYTTSHSPAKSATGVPIGTTQATFSLKDDRTDDEGTTLSTISMTGPDGTKTCSTGTPALSCSGTASNISVTYPGLSLSYEELAQFTLTATDNAGNVLNESWSWTVAQSPGGIPGGGANPPYVQSTYLTGLTWDNTGLARKGPGSDMWPLTWLSDDSIYASYGDGGGINGWNDVCRTRFGGQVITGTPTNFSANNLYGCKSDDTGCVDTEWSSHDPVCNASYASQFTGEDDYGYGIIAIDSVIYAILTDQTAPLSTSLAHSENGGQTWAKYAWSWSRTSAGDWFPFGFVQFGKAYAGARDTYLYLVGSSMNDNGVHTYLARVPKTDVGTQGSYEWYTSSNPASPTWGTWANRQPAFTDNNAAFLSGIHYFPTIGRYIATASHGYDGVTEPWSADWNTGDLGKLGVFEAQEPWGPWYTVYYSDNWQGFSGQYALQFPIVQKWTSANNLDFYMVYSSGEYLDSWNLFKGTFELTPFPTLTVTTTTLADGQVGTSTPQTLSASGGTSPYTWSVTVGSAPPGRSLSPGGTLTGFYTTTGTTEFTVQVQDAQSNTDTQVLSQYVEPAAPTGQITATITDIADTFIDTGTADTNYSDNTASRVYQWPYGTVANRVLDNISLSSLPTNISITSASLEVYLTDHDGSGGTDPMRVYVRGVSGTVPNITTVTWTNFAGTLGSYNRYTDVTLVPGWFSFNVLEETQAAYAAGIPLYLALDGSTYGNQDTNRIFASMDHGTAAWRPRLKVTYTQLTGPPPAPSIMSPGKLKVAAGKISRWRSFK